MTIHRRFQHHFIRGISQLRSPEEIGRNRFNQGCHRIEKYSDLGLVKPRCNPVRFQASRGLIFKHERDIRQQRDGSLQSSHQERG